MPDTDLPLPLEIPWRLAASTQRLREGFPEDTTISLFVYEPRTPTLNADYPDEQLVFLKFTVSVSPVSLDDSALPDWVRSQFFGGLPVLHLVLDVGVTPEPFATGGLRPYFHAAAPLRRAMVETGVIGQQVFEGESDSVSVGRSASQLFESVDSKVTTKHRGSSSGLPGIFDVDVSRTETRVGSDRSAQQYQETVNRDASIERRELLSHLTHVENVLTLLHAKHVGSPYLRFALSPRPLAAPAQDGNDPQRWVRTLLQRRASGIEGIQEFLGLVAVPRGQRFCVQALLRRFAVLDDPPQPPVFPRNGLSAAEQVPLLDYLYRKYPVGLPLDALDLDVTDQFEFTDFVPSLLGWSVQAGPWDAVTGLGLYPMTGPQTNTGAASFLYKTGLEVRRDMLVDGYLAELLRSPLDRGVVLVRSNELRACFRPGDAGLRVGSFGVDATPPRELGFAPGTGRPRGPRFAAADDPADASAVAATWTALDQMLTQQAAAAPRNAGTPLALASGAVLDVLLRRWSRLADDDPLNLSLARAATALGLSAASVSALRGVGAVDLTGVAKALLHAASGERYNRELAKWRTQLPKHVLCRQDPQPLEGLLPTSSVERVRAEIARVTGPAPAPRPRAALRAPAGKPAANPEPAPAKKASRQSKPPAARAPKRT